ncbi:hypothetical protein [Streptomyces sp. NPDC002671]
MLDLVRLSAVGVLGERESWGGRSDAVISAPHDIAARLGIADGDYCVRTTYEHLVDGKPVYLTTGCVGGG